MDKNLLEATCVDVMFHINPKDNIKVAAYIDTFVDNYSDYFTDKQAGVLKVAAKILASSHVKD